MQPLTLTPISIPRKDSTDISDRSLLNRNNTAKNLIKLISGESDAAFVTQTRSLVRSLDAKERENILKKIEKNIPTESVAAMKATLNIPWNQMREISRWLSTFNIKLASEKNTRKVVKEWVGEGLIAELAPLTIKKAGQSRVSVIQVPWVYLYNLVGHVLRRLDDLREYDQLISYSFIPSNEIQIKIGGDHGQNSFKMGYQVANISHPNRKENTTIFSIFEAKDSISNLRTCLGRYCSQIDMLQKQTWNQKTIRVFLYGDYEFLCAMYGLSGASGEYFLFVKSYICVSSISCTTCSFLSIS